MGFEFACPLGSWNIDCHAHQSLRSHRYSLWKSGLMDSHVYMQTLPPFKCCVRFWGGNWRFPISLCFFLSSQAKIRYLIPQYSNSLWLPVPRAHVIVVSPQFLTFPWVYNGFILLIFPVPLFPIAHWQSVGNILFLLLFPFFVCHTEMH